MLELSAFVKSRKTNNTHLKLFPIFYKLSPDDLGAAKVKTEWTKEWKKMVVEGRIQAEQIALWSEAVTTLRAFNGLDFTKCGPSEVKYRAAVVDEICKCVPPVMKYNTDRVRGYQRMCEVTSSMFEEGMSEGHICKQGRMYLGLYGMGGVGKTTLCGAMCSYFQAEFRGRVCHVELQSDAASGRVARLRHAVQQLSGFDNRIVDMITSEPQQGDGHRSRVILESIFEEAKPIPRLQALEATELFLSVAAPRELFHTLQPTEHEIVKACLQECQFVEEGYSTQQYHPLVLRALGSYFHDVDKDDIMSWKEALSVENKLQASRESKHVNNILGLNYSTLSDTDKLIFLDVAFAITRLDVFFKISGEERTPSMPFESAVKLLSAYHGVSHFDAKMKVKELQRKWWVRCDGNACGNSYVLKRLRRNLAFHDPEHLWTCHNIVQSFVTFDCGAPWDCVVRMKDSQLGLVRVTRSLKLVHIIESVHIEDCNCSNNSDTCDINS